MAYVVPGGSVMQMIIEGRHEQQQVMSVFTYKIDASPSITDGAAVLDLFWSRIDGAGRFLDVFTQCLSEQMTGIRVRLQWISPTRFAFVTRVSADYFMGNVAGAAMPVNTAVAMTKRTQNAGRSQVGTLHMPAVPAAAIVNGAVQAAAIARYELFGAKLLAVVTTLGTVINFTPILFHKTSPGVSQPLANFETSRFARVQRRRTVGLGS